MKKKTEEKCGMHRTNHSKSDPITFDCAFYTRNEVKKERKNQLNDIESRDEKIKTKKERNEII